MAARSNREIAERVPCDKEYLLALGRAVYNYASLEGQLIDLWYLIDSEAASRSAGMTASQIIRGFRETVDDADLPSELKKELDEWAQALHQLRQVRNDLLHAHPYTEEGGEQRLWRSKHGRSADENPEDLYRAAARFTEAGAAGNDLYYRQVKPYMESHQ